MIDLTTVEGIERLAELELDRYLERLQDAGEAPPTTHLVVLKDPDTGKRLDKPAAHQLMYQDMDDQDIRRSERQLAKHLEACASIHLWVDDGLGRVVIVAQHSEGTVAAFRSITRGDDGKLTFGELTDLAPETKDTSP